MITENQFYQTFDTIKPHIDAIAKTMKSRGIDAAYLHFHRHSMEMHAFNNNKDAECGVMTITYTPPVEERIELSKWRGDVCL